VEVVAEPVDIEQVQDLVLPLERTIRSRLAVVGREVGCLLLLITGLVGLIAFSRLLLLPEAVERVVEHKRPHNQVDQVAERPAVSLMLVLETLLL